MIPLAESFWQQNGGVDAAVTTYERVLTIDPDNSLAKENLAAIQKTA